MRVLLIDGHPDRNRLSAHLLDTYQAALPKGVTVDRIAVRDLAFEPDLSRGYEDVPPMEPEGRDLDLAIGAPAGRRVRHLMVLEGGRRDS